MTDHSTTPDELGRLLERCVRKDQLAFKALYDSTYRRLYATLFRILRVESIAEDALQETYVKVWNNAADFNPELGQPLTWMTSIARYQALDMLRKRRIREDKETQWDESASAEVEEAVKAQLDPSQLAEYQDILDECFGRLSESQRLCILHAFLEGLSHDELSVSMKSPVGTVKSWIRRGLVSLKECINEYT